MNIIYDNIVSLTGIFVKRFQSNIYIYIYRERESEREKEKEEIKIIAPFHQNQGF